MTLKLKAFNGIVWVTLSKLMLKIINFAITIVLARLLNPADFGLVALALVFVNFFEITRDLGMESALIHYDGKEEDKSIAYNTAFIIYPLFALVLYFVSYFSAPYAAMFFGTPNIESIMKVLTLTIVIWSFGTLPRTILIKELNFKRMFFPQILPKLSYGFLSIVMAYSGYGVWSLVFGRVILEITSVIVYWEFIEWRPSLLFNKEKALDLISFGKYVTIAGLITFILSNVPIVLIGKVLDTESIGYYTISLTIASMATVQLSLIIHQVIFPIYSKIQTNMNQLSHTHLVVIKQFSIITVPAAFGIVLISRELIEVIYGVKWLPSVHILQILCIYGMFTSFQKLNSTVFLASGKPEITAKINYVQLAILVVLVYPLTIIYGVYGTSFAVAVSVVVSSLYSFIYLTKILKITVVQIFSNILIALRGSILMIIGVVLLQNTLVGCSKNLILFSSIATGIFIYGSYFIVLHRKYIKEEGLLNSIIIFCKNITNSI